jgi:hypothetical protein
MNRTQPTMRQIDITKQPSQPLNRADANSEISALSNDVLHLHIRGSPGRSRQPCLANRRIARRAVWLRLQDFKVNVLFLPARTVRFCRAADPPSCPSIQFHHVRANASFLRNALPTSIQKTGLCSCGTPQLWRDAIE